MPGLIKAIIAGFLSFAAQLFGFSAVKADEPLVNPVWATALQQSIASQGGIGAFIGWLPPLIFASILSFLIFWMVIFAVLSVLRSVWQIAIIILLVFVVGFLLYGGIPGFTA